MIVCFCFVVCVSSGCFVLIGISRVMEICCDVYLVFFFCSFFCIWFLVIFVFGFVVRIKFYCKIYRGRCEVFGDSEENLGIIGILILIIKFSIR